MDEYLFGWSQSQQPKASSHDSDGASEHGGHSGYVSGYTTDEPADYDEVRPQPSSSLTPLTALPRKKKKKKKVIHILSREQDGTDATSPASDAGASRYRRSSRSRSRSQLDLTALDAAVSPLGALHATALEDPAVVKRLAAGKRDE